MNKHLTVLVVFIAIFFTGCFEVFQAKPSKKHTFSSGEKQHKKVSIHKNKIALKSYDFTKLQGIRVTSTFKQPHMFGKIYIKKNRFIRKFVDKDNDKIYYCGKYYYAPNQKRPTHKVCFIDEANSINSYGIRFGKHNKYIDEPFDILNDFNYKHSYLVSHKKRAYKRELIFNGVKNGKVKFVYKYYENNLKKYTTKRKIKFKLKNKMPTIIRYKGAKLKIYKATNTKLTYSIIKGF